MNFEIPHRRLNVLTGEWVLVSPHRARRPWLGQVEKTPAVNLPQYDPTCYLCPGNGRAGGKQNPGYTSTFVFDNDFPALYLDGASGGEATAETKVELPGKLYQAQPVDGICRVVCFSPRHDLTFPELALEQAAAVIQTWTQQTVEIGGRDFCQYVQVFENKGEMMGCSNPHPHSQIWSSSVIPVEPMKELVAQEKYYHEQENCLLCDLLAEELRNGERIVETNEHFTAFVPFWATWPFEILLIGKRHTAYLSDLRQEEVTSLAELMRRITARYDNLFEISFPYSMGFHQAPTTSQAYPAWHLHAHYYPPLLRSATVRKFMVGYEMLAMPQRDITPETAAQRLRSISSIHYKQR